MDERTRYFRRLKRLRGSARRWSVIGGGLAAATAVLTPYAGIGIADAAGVARLDEIRASMNQKRGDTTAAG